MKKMVLMVTMMLVMVVAAFAKTKTTQCFVENNTGNTIAVVASNENGDVLWENGYIIVEPEEVIVVEVDWDNKGGTVKSPTQYIAIVFNFDVETGVCRGGSWGGLEVLDIGTLSFAYGEKGPRIQLKTPFALNGQRIFKF